jgi:hypothetical protein
MLCCSRASLVPIFCRLRLSMTSATRSKNLIGLLGFGGRGDILADSRVSTLSYISTAAILSPPAVRFHLWHISSFRFAPFPDCLAFHASCKTPGTLRPKIHHSLHPLLPHFRTPSPTALIPPTQTTYLSMFTIAHNHGNYLNKSTDIISERCTSSRPRRRPASDYPTIGAV